ncbi:unnamed protein product, partial [Choristocarpus tenellus]
GTGGDTGSSDARGAVSKGRRSGRIREDKEREDNLGSGGGGAGGAIPPGSALLFQESQELEVDVDVEEEDDGWEERDEEVSEDESELREMHELQVEAGLDNFDTWGGVAPRVQAPSKQPHGRSEDSSDGQGWPRHTGGSASASKSGSPTERADEEGTGVGMSGGGNRRKQWDVPTRLGREEHLADFPTLGGAKMPRGMDLSGSQLSMEDFTTYPGNSGQVEGESSSLDMPPLPSKQLGPVGATTTSSSTRRGGGGGGGSGGERN